MLIRSLWIYALLGSLSQAFIFNAFTAYPALQELAKAQKDCQLSIRLEVGKKNFHKQVVEDGPRFCLDGLQVDLRQEPAPKGHVGLPGCNGPHPQTSSGARAVDIDKLPSFVGMNGLESVDLENAAWEMVWRESAPSGSLVCGFDVPNEVTRNSAKLPAGRLYISFPIWTRDLLVEQQTAKADCLKRAAEYNAEKNHELEEMQKTENLFMKAVHYRNAAAAYEKMELTGVRSYQWIPDMDDVVLLKDDLLVGTTGSIWTVSKDIFRAKTLLGGAEIRIDPSEQLRP